MDHPLTGLQVCRIAKLSWKRRFLRRTISNQAWYLCWGTTFSTTIVCWGTFLCYTQIPCLGVVCGAIMKNHPIRSQAGSHFLELPKGAQSNLCVSNAKNKHQKKDLCTHRQRKHTQIHICIHMYIYIYIYIYLHMHKNTIEFCWAIRTFHLPPESGPKQRR